jgi:hypothetical protein
VSDFAAYAAFAHSAVEAVYGDPVTIGTTEGTAIVIPQDDMMLGDGVQMIGGAVMTYRVEDFPDVSVHDSVTVGTASYTIVELDDVSLAGLIRARLAPT